MKHFRFLPLLAVAAIACLGLAAHAAGIDASTLLSPDMATAISMAGAAGMTTKYVMSGDVIDYVAGSAVSSGQVLLIGARVGVAMTAIASGATGAVAVEGVFTIAKLSTDVVAQGALLYWDNANSRLTTTVGSNVLAGYAAKAAGNGVTTVEINLNA